MLKIILASGIVCAIAGAAQAATLFAGPLQVPGDFPGSNGHTIECSIVNVGKKDVEVTITSELDNTVVAGPLTLAPGATESVANTNWTQIWERGHCRFDVQPGTKNVRASICLWDENHHCRAVAPAS